MRQNWADAIWQEEYDKTYANKLSQYTAGSEQWTFVEVKFHLNEANAADICEKLNKNYETFYEISKK